MIRILAVLALTVMCFLISEHLAITKSEPQYFFMLGWLSSIATGLFVNWFIKSTE